MKLGIIGAGNIGGVLARKFTELGHQVRVANSRGPQTLTAFAKETGARAVTVEDAVRDVELVVITIPQKAVAALPAGLFRDVPRPVVVVDTGNYYPPRDGRIEAIENGETEAGWVANVIGRPVVKAFNNITVASLANGGRSRGAADRIALPIAGDDANHKATVQQLVEALGFDAVDAGPLASSWRQQPGTPAYATDYGAHELPGALARADRARAVTRRDQGTAKLATLPPDLTNAQFVALVRELFDPR